MDVIDIPAFVFSKSLIVALLSLIILGDGGVASGLLSC